MKLTQSPYILYSDGNGNIYEDETLYALGRSGWDALEVTVDEWIPLPEGGNLYELPGRRGIGLDVKTGEMRLCEKGWAVAAFIPPAYTSYYLSPYETMPQAPVLPLFCYTAAAWYNNVFYVSAVRIEQDIRQEKSGYNDSLIQNGVQLFTKKYPHNRLVKHLAETCCNTYQCPAARNFFLSRWECPVPSSPACNANCIGCISFQPENEHIESSHDRLVFKPSVEEIVEYTVPHLETAPYPIVSWGQGCEGEPLLMWETIRDSIIEIRKHTPKGSLNINTNGSNPKAVKKLMEAGLNSIRVSLNSFRNEYYTPYYRPNNYELKDLLESIKIVNDMGGWTSINYFVFPGCTDSIAEIEALLKAIEYTNLKMIQWRNFNIDPDWYLGKLGITDTGERYGMQQALSIIKETFPHIQYGYFNPPMERIKGNFKEDFAH